jgi:hypothetical protein
VSVPAPAEGVDRASGDRPAAGLAQLEETIGESIEVLSDSAALADIDEADAAWARAGVRRGIDAVRRRRS